MGRMKDKLMDMMENPDYYSDEGMDGGDEYELLLPKGMKNRDLWEKLERQEETDEQGEPEELDFDLD